jgi:hypothetical protein
VEEPTEEMVAEWYRVYVNGSHKDAFSKLVATVWKAAKEDDELGKCSKCE